MKRTFAIVLAVAALGVGVYLYRHRGSSSTPTAAAPPPTRDLPIRPLPPSPPDAAAAIANTPALDAAIATATPNDARAVPDAHPAANSPDTQARMSDVHAHLQDLARPCLAETHAAASANQQVRFQFTIAVTKGAAKITDVNIVMMDVSPELAGCILDKLDNAHWPDDQGDFTTTAEDSLYPAELD